jgi:drug/metabolite transporter (DMT)-like permease
MFPVVALALSLAFEGMRVTVAIIVGTTLVLLGNLLVLKKGS